MKINSIVHEIIYEIFPSINGEIKHEWGPNDIQDWDSLNHLNLVMAINHKFEINLEFEEVMSIEKIDDIFRILDKKGIKVKLKFKIEDSLIGKDQPCFIIGEIGSNHNRDKQTVFDLIDACAIAGFDAVKFQIYDAEEALAKMK